MTEQEWLACTDPEPMLEFVRGKVSDRKLRLLACACCRRIWHLPDSKESSHHAVETAERYADGLVGEEDIRQAEQAAWDAWYPDEAPPLDQMGFIATAAFALTTGRSFQHTRPTGAIIQRVTWEYIRDSVQNVLWVAGREEEEGRFEPERDRRFRHEVADLMRCVFGNPFRSVTHRPEVLAWNGGTVVKLAHAIYEERGFERLAILADALEEAGCDNADLLSHCREAADHTRGCWAIDRILGKE